MGLHRVDDVVHGLRGLPHRQPPDGEAVTGQLGDLLHVPHPQLRVGPALVDAEEHLLGIDTAGLPVQPLVLRHAALQPAVGPGTGGLHIVEGGGVLDALVKGHGDVAAQIGLDLHGLLRSHEDPTSVDMGGEGDALLRYLTQAGQRKDLKSAAVGEDGAIPVHKPVQSAQLPHHPVSRPQVEVVGVGQLDLTAQRLQVVGGDRPLDGPLGPDIHKNRGLGSSMGAGEHATPGPALRLQDLKHKKTPLPYLVPRRGL